MKAQCERCKEIVPLEFAVEGDGIRVRCGGCGETYRVAASTVANTSPSPSPSPDTMTCPKCGEEQRKAEACRRCGLVIAKWTGEAIEGGELGALFEKAGSEAEHEAFIEEARKRGMLAYAAARYRQKGDKERLEKIRRIAEQALVVAPRREVKPADGRARTVMLGAMIVIVIAMAFLLLRGFSVPE